MSVVAEPTSGNPSCDVRGCDRVAVAAALVEFPDGERTVMLCAIHVHLAGGGAIWQEHLERPA